MAPVLPSGDAATVSPSVNNAPVKIPSGSMAIPSGDKPVTTRRRGHRKKPKTTPASTTSSSATSNDDDSDSPNGGDTAKEAIKRAIRAILNRQ